MTREEAIKDIEENILPVVGGKSLRMAVDALKAQTDGDTISRQAAIDAIFSEQLYKSGMKKRDADAVVPAIYEKIKSLPSAQPKERTKERTETHACDLINRQAAIDLIDGIETEWLKGTVELIYAPAIKGLRALPSAQPELIEKAAYIRGFEQGRTQGMIDAQGGKK